MAINPNTVNILNIEELNQASSIENDDLIVIGQGIYARKSTVYQLYQKFGLENIEDAIFELQQQQGDVDLTTVLRFVEQTLQESEKQTARNNISALDVKMSELSNDLTASEKAIIKSKLGITGGGGSGSTSLFDDIFVYNETENPEQEFELSFVPYQIVTVLDNNQMKWLDDGDYEVNGQTLKMLYPLENGTKLRINYYHNL